MRLRNILAVTRKETRVMRHDHGLLAAILIQPILYLVLFGMAITNEVTNAEWVVYDQSHTDLSRRLISDLTSLTALQEPRHVSSEDDVSISYVAIMDLPASSFRGTSMKSLCGDKSRPSKCCSMERRRVAPSDWPTILPKQSATFSLTQLPTRDRSEQRDHNSSCDTRKTLLV